MPISLSQLKAVVREIPIPIEGETLKIWYKPYEMTPELLDLAQRRDADPAGAVAVVTPEMRAERAQQVASLISDFIKAKDKSPEALAAGADAIVAAANAHGATDAKTASGNTAMVLALIQRWDLSDVEGGEPLPITVESLGGIAFKVTSLILDAIIEDQRPSQPKPEGSFGS